MGHNQRCPVFHQCLHSLLYRQFGCGVDVGSGFIEEDQLGVPCKSPGNRNKLAFAAGYGSTAFAQDGVQPLGQSVDQGPAVGSIDDKLLLGCSRILATLEEARVELADVPASLPELTFTLNGTPIGDSPFTSQVGPGPASPTQSIATVPAGTAGLSTFILVQVRDAYGNPLTVGGQTVGVTVSAFANAAPRD